jgi:hypothetical protein
LVGAYLANLGLSYAAVRYITSAAPSEMQWLSFRDAIAYGISVQSTEETRFLAEPKGALRNVSPPNYDTAKRAVKNLWVQMKKGGMLGLAASVQQCFERSSEIRTIDSLQYCFTLDLITSELERYGRTNLGVPPLDYLSASQVLNRTSKVLESYGVSAKDKQLLLDAWSEMAFKANVEVGG